MMYDNWGMGGWLGMSLLWIIWLAIAAFVFGIIFWWTKKLIDKK